MKTCTNCNETKEFQNFAVFRKSRLNECKECRNKKRQKKCNYDDDFEYKGFETYILTEAELEFLIKYPNIPKKKPKNVSLLWWRVASDALKYNCFEYINVDEDYPEFLKDMCRKNFPFDKKIIKQIVLLERKLQLAPENKNEGVRFKIFDTESVYNNIIYGVKYIIDSKDILKNSKCLNIK